MSMFKVTPLQRANALEARDRMWPEVEAKMVNLESWRSEGPDADYSKRPDCGSTACFGGWVAWWPAFRAQGVTASPDTGEPMMGDPDESFPSIVAEKLFGDRELFKSSYRHEADWKGLPGVNSPSDHELVANRLDWLIENSEVVGDEQVKTGN